MRPSIPATLLLLAAALPAGAVEFVPTWATDVIWTSNVFRSLDEDQQGRTIPKEDDFSFRVGPDLRVREQQGDLRYDLLYQLRYEEFVRLNGISEFDQFAQGNVDWAITDRTAISAYDNFAYTSSLGGLFDFVDQQQAIPIVRAVRQRITTNSAGGSIRHRLGKLWELTISADNQLYDYGDEISSESISSSGNVQITRGVTPRLVLGMGGMAQRQESSDDLGATDGGSTFFQAFGIANYQFSRTLRLSFSAGPAMSMPDQEEPGLVTVDGFAATRNIQGIRLALDPASCPVSADGRRFVPLAQAFGQQVDGPQCTEVARLTGNPTFFVQGSTSDLDVPFVGDTGLENAITYFARVNLEKQWRTWRGSLNYSRSATNASGLGTSTIVDSFFGQIIWTPSVFWSFTLNGTLSIQSAISEASSQLLVIQAENQSVTGVNINGQQLNGTASVGVPIEIISGETIDNPIDVRTYRVELRAERKFTKHLSSTASASWYQQTNSGVISDNARHEIRFVLGVVWKFDPIPL